MLIYYRERAKIMKTNWKSCFVFEIETETGVKCGFLSNA